MPSLPSFGLHWHAIAMQCIAMHWCALSPAKTFNLCSTLGAFWRCIAGQSWHIQKMLNKLNLFESTHCSLCILNQNTAQFFAISWCLMTSIFCHKLMSSVDFKQTSLICLRWTYLYTLFIPLDRFCKNQIVDIKNLRIVAQWWTTFYIFLITVLIAFVDRLRVVRNRAAMFLPDQNLQALNGDGCVRMNINF